MDARTGFDLALSPPAWLAAFESSSTSGTTQQVLKYARVLGVTEQSREEFFHASVPGGKQGRMYYVLHLGPTARLTASLIPKRPRRTVFIKTTLARLLGANEFNDLFEESPPEDSLWERLKLMGIPAERQWFVTRDHRSYFLDFALFCRQRKIDLELDGYQHHAVARISENDAFRDTDLTALGWGTHRILAADFRANPVREMLRLGETIEAYGGIEEAGARFVPTPTGPARQLTLLEERAHHGRAAGGTE